MPTYAFVLEVPPNTPITKPKKLTVEVEGRRLDLIRVKWPGGCLNSVYFAIFYGAHRLFPDVEGEWVTGDNETKEYPVGVDLPKSPCRLQLRAYNVSDRWTYKLNVELITSELLMPTWAAEILTRLRRIEEFLGI